MGCGVDVGERGWLLFVVHTHARCCSHENIIAQARHTRMADRTEERRGLWGEKGGRGGDGGA
jgi:hypothetical protein